MRHPFIANLQFAFQDKEHLYLGLDLLEGGDLRRHIAHRKTFKEHEAKFIIACLILAL